MDMFSNYEIGRSIRRSNGKAADCDGSEQVNGYWREDQEIALRQRKQRQSNGLHLLIKPQAAQHVGYRAA